MSIIMVALGFMMLVIGRQFYITFVGTIGFIVGVYVVQNFSPNQTFWGFIFQAVPFAILGVIMAIFFRRWMARAAGVLACIYLVDSVPVIFGVEAELVWPVYAVLAVLFLVLTFVWFDGALIFLSILTGAAIVVQNMSLGALNPTVMYFLLLVFGVVAQFILLQYGSPSPD